MIDFAPQIDFSRIAFPTDQLTVGQLRERFPEEFKGEKVTFFYDQKGMELTSTIDIERELAKHAFDAVLGRKKGDPEAAFIREELEDCLAGSYVFLRMAKGKHEASQMVREVISAAEAQAMARLGRNK